MSRPNTQSISRLIAILTFLLVVSAHQPAHSMVVLPACFSDNMVLQQRSLAVLWGSARPANKLVITTSWNHKSYSILVPASGKWELRIPTPEAGGPYTMSFNDGQLVQLKNVLIGEVWICSGQSNMEMPLAGWGKVKNFREEIAGANFPKIRLLTVNKAVSNTPLDSFSARSGGWEICSPASIAEFSAAAYFFGRNLFLDRHIPIGLIHTSWGGTPAEAWTSSASLKKMPDFTASLTELSVQAPADAGKNIPASGKEELDKADSGFQGGKPLWAFTSYNSGSWKTMQLPSPWQSAGLAGFNGIVWFRKLITVPASQAGKDLRLLLGPVNSADQTWFNGEEIGQTRGSTSSRVYLIPGKFVKEGENLITVRITDTHNKGGMNGRTSEMQVRGQGGFFISLAGEWFYKQGTPALTLPAAVQTNPNKPTVLYNAMISPLLPYTIKGVIWYQGESNAGRAWQYRTLFPLMITDWRQHWHQGNFPFLFVQLANFTDSLDHPAESDWAELREAQQKTLALPNTGMAVIIDIGEGKNIHPKNKQDVGLRLALVARAKVYHEKIEYSGPVFTSYKPKKNLLILNFSHAAGLKTSDNKAPAGFAIAGADHIYHWATARIRGNQVLLSSSEVPVPTGVRYGWANNPDCNLINGTKLPASPFRSDQWTEITRK